MVSFFLYVLFRKSKKAFTLKLGKNSNGGHRSEGDGLLIDFNDSSEVKDEKWDTDWDDGVRGNL